MSPKPTRREFLHTAAVGGGLWLAGAAGCAVTAARPAGPVLVSPGCRTSKVKVAKVYLGRPKAHWPTPDLELGPEVASYEADFARREADFADVDWVVNQLVTAPAQIAPLKEKIAGADGLLVIHLSMGVMPMLRELLALKRPTMLYAAPYSGHEWTGFGALTQQPEGALLDCLLTSDRAALAEAVRPFRAMHHLREAKVLNVTTRDFSKFAADMKAKFGTTIVTLDRDRVLKAYEAVPAADAEAEAARWIAGAERVVEPPRDEIVRSCQLALALQNLMDQEAASLVTVDCYGSMWRRLPAYPCIAFARANNLGLGGICESDLRSSMTFILFQGLTGRPGFVSDPTMDVSKGGIVLAHCMGSPCMDGPAKPPAKYRLRTIMERQEGAVTQVFMRVGQRVTQAILVGSDTFRYFTGTIVETPDLPRGCRTKITVKVDGSPERLWKNWAHGLHRVTCYGDLRADLARFGRFAGVQMVDEA